MWEKNALTAVGCFCSPKIKKKTNKNTKKITKKSFYFIRSVGKKVDPIDYIPEGRNKNSSSSSDNNLN
jgi:hypothetical protein